MFVLAILTTILIISINGSGRIRYNDIIDEKDKQGKNSKKSKPKDILSIKFGAGYKNKTAAGDNGESEDEIEDELLD